MTVTEATSTPARDGRRQIALSVIARRSYSCEGSHALQEEIRPDLWSRWLTSNGDDRSLRWPSLNIDNGRIRSQELVTTLRREPTQLDPQPPPPPGGKHVSWIAVARKDLRDAIRSWRFLALSAVFVVLFAGLSLLFVTAVSEQVAATDPAMSVTSDQFLFQLSQFSSTLLPLIAIAVGYAAVSRERESGTAKLLLSLPHSRRDVLFGKVAGRGATLVVPVLLGFLFAAVPFFLTPVRFEPITYVAFALLTGLFGLTFVALSVGISAAVATSRRAFLASLVAYVVFVFVWDRIVGGLVSSVERLFSPSLEMSVGLSIFLENANPINAYQWLTVSMSGADPFRQQFIDAIFGGTLPLYLSTPATIVLLVGWVVAPPVLGYLAFRVADL